jgi:hypothetical protein
MSKHYTHENITEITDAEILEALPGVDIAELRAALSAPPGLIDLNELFQSIIAMGRTFEAANRVCVAIEPTFTPVLAA